MLTTGVEASERVTTDASTRTIADAYYDDAPEIAAMRYRDCKHYADQKANDISKIVPKASK
jgi:hypothetical protein